MERAVEGAAEAYKKQTDAGPWAWPLPPLAVFAFCTVVVGFLTLCVGALNVALVVLQRRALYAQERPWLVPSPPRSRVRPNDEGYVEFRYGVVNYGKSPAWITSRRVSVARVVNRENWPAVRAYDLNPDENLVAPGEKWLDYRIEDLSDDDRRALMNYEFEYLLYGAIDYRDIFDHTHTCGFAWLIFRWNSPFAPGGQWTEGQWTSIRGPAPYWTST